MPRFLVDAPGAGPTECGVDPARFVPASDEFGRPLANVLGCARCGHGWVPVDATGIEAAYAEAADPDSLREEPARIVTAERDLAVIEHWVHPGRLLDVGCWTGSLLVAARQRGWSVAGIEPSLWAHRQATARGLDVQNTALDEADIPKATLRAVVACDVIEHLVDPASAAAALAAALAPGGVAFITVPDAGSRVARLLGRRWWSVLPMHVQYFTRRSMRVLVERAGFRVEHVGTHPKRFTAAYYADRVASFVPVLGRTVPTTVAALGVAGRIVGPDLRDRMAVVARKQ